MNFIILLSPNEEMPFSVPMTSGWLDTSHQATYFLFTQVAGTSMHRIVLSLYAF